LLGVRRSHLPNGRGHTLHRTAAHVTDGEYAGTARVGHPRSRPQSAALDYPDRCASCECSVACSGFPPICRARYAGRRVGSNGRTLWSWSHRTAQARIRLRSMPVSQSVTTGGPARPGRPDPADRGARQRVRARPAPTWLLLERGHPRPLHRQATGFARLSELLARLAERDDASSGSRAAKSFTTSRRPFSGSTSKPKPPLTCVSAAQRRFFGRADRI
jgi:hypothetical protein